MLWFCFEFQSAMQTMGGKGEIIHPRKEDSEWVIQKTNFFHKIEIMLLVPFTNKQINFFINS